MIRIVRTSSVMLMLIYSALAPLSAMSAPDGAKTAETSTARPMVVAVYDDNCSVSCSIVRPLMKELSQTYQDKVSFHELNVSSGKMDESSKKAGELGVSSFFKASAPYIPCVGIFNSDKTLLKELPAAKPKSAYVKYIEKAIKSK